MYIYKSKSKFPHWVYQNADTINLIGSYLHERKTFEWCRNNLGDYGKRWMNAHANAVTIQHREEWYCYPYRFKSLDDAMAFKLVWL